MNQIKLLEKTWKGFATALVILTLTFSGLFLNLATTSAEGTPNMTARLVANDDSDSPDQGWQHTINSQAGHRVSFTLEIHNTVVGTKAENVKARVEFPSGVRSSHNIPAFVTTTNANSASDTVTVNVTNPAQGAEFRYVAGSTRLYWDMDGNGVKEFDNTPLVDGIAQDGLVIGHQKGCNEFIIQITFLGELVAPEVQPTPSPSPTPTPTPTPVPSPTPPAGGQEQNQDQNQTQNNNQTVNVTQSQTINNPTPVVAGVKAPVVQPETGVGVLSMASFALAPIGLALARYGRGRVNLRKREEEINGLSTIKERIVRKAA